jgi:hypothetical protein
VPPYRAPHSQGLECSSIPLLRSYSARGGARLIAGSHRIQGANGGGDLGVSFGWVPRLEQGSQAGEARAWKIVLLACKEQGAKGVVPWAVLGEVSGLAARFAERRAQGGARGTRCCQ